MSEMVEINSVQPRDPELAKTFQVASVQVLQFALCCLFCSARCLRTYRAILGYLCRFRLQFHHPSGGRGHRHRALRARESLRLPCAFRFHDLLRGDQRYLAALASLAFIGREVNGANSSIRIGGFSMQPGEFAKITVVLLAASIMSRYGGRLDDLREYLKALGILAIPFICVMTQPDMGTGLVYLCIAAFALIIGGANWRFLVATAAILAALVVGVFMLDPILDGLFGQRCAAYKDYQRSRLLVFMDSELRPLWRWL